MKKVSVGPSSIAGWGAAVVGLAPIIVKSIEAGQIAYRGPEKLAAIAGIVALAITQIGRYVQSFLP